ALPIYTNARDIAFARLLEQQRQPAAGQVALIERVTAGSFHHLRVCVDGARVDLTCAEVVKPTEDGLSGFAELMFQSKLEPVRARQIAAALVKAADRAERPIAAIGPAPVTPP